MIVVPVKFNFAMKRH